jgi:hypothetical protein
VTPTGPALSKARALLGEAVMRRIFEIDAARKMGAAGPVPHRVARTSVIQ